MVDALLWAKLPCAANCEHTDAHQKSELEHAEVVLPQALHFAKRTHNYHLCTLSLASIRKCNLDCDWSDAWDEEAIEYIRFMFE
jgi:hypothetical protein